MGMQANWLQNFILGLGIVESIVKPLKIYRDNFAVVFFSKNKYSKGAKHMELKYIAVKKKFRNKECQLNTLAPIL